ncbi:MAG TPA: alpha/beta fold hydrolase, partial [Beggiatoa sp.]|nr:alpha/beta fold hydrolase [Beggiatoa sp.]
AEVQPLLDQEPLFKQHLENVHDCLSSLEDIPRVIKEGFYRSDWLMPPLYSFMVNYAYLSTLITLGFTPRLIMGQQSGHWLSLTLSGMIKLEDALSVLSTQKDVQQLELAAPQIPIYDPVSQQTIRPVHFDEDTLHNLVDNLNIATASLHHFVERALLLKDNQFTFKKYLEEWDRILRQQTGKTLDARLTDEALLHSEPDASQKEKILLTLIIKSTLRQLDKKWDLTRSQRITDPKFQALLDLIIKGVMLKEEVVELFLKPQPDWTTIAARLNDRQAKLDISQQNPFIKTQTLPFKGPHEVTEWFKSAMTLEEPYPVMSENRAYLDFGLSPEQIVSEPLNQIAITDNQTETFKKTLLGLWLQGIDLKTDCLFPEGSFNKVSLPTYGFDRKAFWLTTENELSSQKSVTKSPLEALKNNRPPGEEASQTTLPKPIDHQANQSVLSPPPHTESQPLISPPASSTQLEELVPPVQKPSQQTILTHEEQHKMTHSKLNDDNVSNSSDHQNQITSCADEVFLSEEDSCRLLKKTTQYLKDIVAKKLDCQPNDIENKVDLISEYGIDSLANIEILDHLENVFGDLSTTLLSDYSTIEQLTKYFIQSFPQELAKQFGLNQKAAHKTPEKIVPKPLFPTSPKPIPADKKTVAKKAISHPPLENQHKDIAIIGLSGRFPMSSDVDQLWAHLIKGESCTKEEPPERWDYRLYYDKTGNDPNKSYTKWGGFLEDYDKFDPLFFNISPRQAELMDPQQRIVLESAWATLEDAGYTRASLSRKTGVFIGVTTNTYSWLAMEASLNGKIHCPDTDNYDIANRVSYFCDFNGPSLSVDTACSSSLTAIHLAVQSLHRDECKTAIVGGVNLTLHPNRIIQYCQKNMLLIGKDCHPFGEGKGGFVDAEGVATVLLKPLSQAVADGDHIYAIIKATAINADGKTNGYTVPNPKLQSKLITTALKKAQINPRTISYLETHGTGTKTGDPIEIEGITEAFAQYTDALQFCAIGSIKSNIGHLIAGSGVAGLTKVLLQLKHQTLVPSIHSSPPNPHIDFKKTPFVVQQKLAYWQRPQITENGLLKEYPRRVGINSFGAGGANAHIILEEYNASKTESAECEYTPQIIVLSAKNPDRLQAYAQKLIYFLEGAVASKTGTGDAIEKPENRRLILQQHLLTWVSELLQVRETDIGLEEELFEYGLDAVGLTALTRRINEHYQLDLTTALFSEHSSIAAVTQYVCERYSKPAQTSGETAFSAANHTSAQSLGNMAYTLQLGREAMEERLAMVVSSLDEVKDKLTQYAQGQTDIELFYRGHVKAEQAEPLLDGREGEAFLKIIIQDQKLSKLAQLWVSGVEIDWTLLYPHHKPQRITLPTYPFARERYWLPESTTRLPNPVTVGPQLHPFLESNTSTLQEQRYTTSLRGDEFFLADHVVGQQKTFPGVAYLEMAWVAGGMAGERAVQTLKDIVWVQPITVSDTPQRVHISFYPTEASQLVEFEVSTFDDAQERQVHVQGQLIYQNQTTPNAETLDLEAIQKRCTESWVQAKCYRLFQAVGLSYGPGFQSIQTLYRNDTEALSSLVLPASLQSGFNDFVLHPALMDGALQTVIGLMGSSTSGTPLPFALAEVSLIKPLPEQCYAYVTLTPESRDLNVKKFHLWFVDDRGQVLVKLKDFSVRVPRTVETTMYYQSVWEPQISPIQTQAQSISQVLLFERDETRYQALQARLGCEVIWVKPGERYQALGNQVYAINPAQASDYRQLLASLAQQHQFPSHIIHFWSQAPFVCDSTLLANQIDLSLYSVFHLSQALLAQPLKAPIQLLYLYLEPDNAPQPQYAAFSGFAKTIRLENSKFLYKTVALSSLSELVDSVLTEMETTDSVEIRYAHTQRWVKRWKAWEPVQETAPTTRLKEQGVYLVTGGAGGLGLIFAEYLAKQVKEAKLVLTGRSATLNEQQAAKIQAIKALGAEVLYIQADVSKRDDVESMIAQTKAHFGQINGIIHSAGLIRDALLLNKTQDNMAAVLAPKILGSVYLDEATKNDKLDFFVLFSSIVAAMGNIGQSDYAYANSFMDHFAQWREGLRAQEQRFGQTLSINWPLWQEGGMQVDSKKQAWLKQFMGMLPLSTEQGIKAFELGLNLASVQMMVVAGEAEQIKKALNPVIQAPTLAATHNKQPINQSEPDKSPLNQSGPDPSQLQAKTEDYLKNLLSQELKLTFSTIQAHAPLEKYGLDSVMMLSLTRKLENHFGTLSKTLFFEYKNLTELGQYFIKNHREQLIEKISDGASAVPNETKTVAVLPEREQNNLARLTRSRFLNSTESSVSLTPETDIPEDDIAIIGVSGRYPMARDLSAFWENLTAGIDGITEIPKERWDASQYEDANHSRQWGGFIEDVDQFDPLFFNISPTEAEFIDPQERLFLETVWHTLEDAGYPKTSLKDKPVGVFVGVMWGEYQLFGALEKHKGQAMPTASYASIANRISYYFNFQGPSIALDTMCSSSLTAIHLACESLKRGESEIAIAGGVNVSIHPKKYILLGQHQFLSSDGRCRSFGEGGDGYVPGEGVGALLLKPLHQARIDGDHIYAVIKGSSINHGGKTNGYTVPDPNAQASLISSTLKKAQINPRTISYVEAHGTGTSLGDPIEIRGLTKAYQEETVDTQYCAIGSVKSNIGHLESAAGMAALTKVLLQMKYKQLVPSLHSERLNPNINFETSPFYVQHGLTEWKQPILKENGKEIRYPRRAGISSFGAGGANAHLIVEEYEPPLREAESHSQKDYIIVLSAKNEDRLQAYIKKIIDFFNSATVAGEVGTTVNEAELPEPIQPDLLLLADLAYTLQIGREPLEERLAIVVDSIESLTEKLMQYAQGQTEIAHFFHGNVKTSKAHSALLIEGEAGEAFLNMLIEKQELTKLAQLWILGVDIDWQLLYPKPPKPQRIALPTYPFARQRYWIPEKETSLNRDHEQITQRIQSLPDAPTLNHLEAKSTRQSIIKNHSLEAEIDDLKQLFSEALKLDIIHLDEHSMLEEFGVDSLVLMDVVQKMSRRYQLKLKISDLIGLNTIKDFAHYIINFQSSATDIKKVKPESESSLTSLGNHHPLFRKNDPSHWYEQLLENDNDVFSTCDNLNIFQIKSSQGIHIEILSCGKGTPVVLLPPIDCLATAWLYQILELSQQFQVLVFHYPGYGNSEFHDEQSHFEAIGDSILDLLNLININQPFHLVGWSLGGFISQVMAKKYAPHIKSLTLVNTTAKLEEDDSIENAFKLAKLLRDDFELHLPKEMRSKREGSLDFIKATDNNQISLHYIHQVLQFDFRSQMASIQIPTLVIAGGEDHITPPRYAEWIHNNIKGSKYEKLDKGGHYMPLQNAEYFNQQWFNFIQTKSI